MSVKDKPVADKQATIVPKAQGYWSEDRLMMREAARRFTLNEVLPIANELDPQKGDIPDALIEKMAQMGYFGILIPQDKGGLGLGMFEYCLVTEQLAHGWMSVASLIARANNFYTAIPSVIAEREEKIRLMAQGKFFGAMSISEAQAGSDIAAIACRAVRDGKDWVVTGNKYWCTFADRANFLSVICRIKTPANAPRWAGLVRVYFEKEPGQWPQGVTGQPIPKIGYHGWHTYELAFNEARTPAPPPSKDDGQAFKSIAGWLEGARAHTAARSIGLAQGALDDAATYAQTREQFGQPISNFQAIRFKIATMATDIEAARQLLYYVCNEIDSGRRCDKEAAMAKYFASEMSERVTSEALQILGGAGYTTLHAVERYWRDARLTKIFEGSSEIQQRIISDKILGKPQ